MKFEFQRFHMIPDEVYYSSELSPGAKLLYGEILALSAKEGYCWATNDALAKLEQVTVRSIARWILELISHNFIRSDTRNRGRILYILPPPREETEGQNCPSPHDNFVLPPMTKTVDTSPCL